MSLAARITELASRIGLEVKSKITAAHPSVAKAWVNFTYTGSQIAIRSAYNVASVTRLGTGRYRVTFAVALPNASFGWTATALRDPGLFGLQRLGIVRASGDTQTAQFVDVSCALPSAAADADEMTVLVLR